MKYFIKNNNKNIILSIIVSLLLVVLGIGVSYSFWLLEFRQADDNLVETGCFDISFTEDTSALSMINEYPKIDEDGLKGVPYTFTVANICDTNAKVDVKVKVLDGNTLSTDSLKVVVNDDSPSILSDNVLGEDGNYEIFTAYIGSGSSRTFEYRQWIDEDTPFTAMNKNVEVKIVVDAIPSEYKTLSTSLAGVPTKEVNINGNVVNKVYGDKQDRIDLNNYVWFSGQLWQVMEINDDSIKMISSMPLTSIAYGPDSNFNTSWVKKWLDNEFYPILTNKEMIMDTKFCLDSIEESDVTSTIVDTDDNRDIRKVTDHTKISTCTNELTTKVGLMTFEDYVYAYDATTPNYITANYLSGEELEWSMTPYSSNHMWITWYNGSYEYITTHEHGEYFSQTNRYGEGVRPVISISTNALVSSGTGKNNEPFIVADELKQKENDKISTLKVGDYIYLDESNNPNPYNLDRTTRDVTYSATKDKVRYRVVNINDDGSVKVQRSDILRNLPDTVSIYGGYAIPFYYKNGATDADKCGYIGNVWKYDGCNNNNYFKPTQGSDDYKYAEGENIGYFLNNATNSVYNWYSDATKSMIDDTNFNLTTGGFGKDYSKLDDGTGTTYPSRTNDGIVSVKLGLPSWGEMYSGNDLNSSYWLLNRWRGSSSIVSYVFSYGYANGYYAGNHWYGARLVLNLKSENLIKDGSGIMTDPYILQ